MTTRDHGSSRGGGATWAIRARRAFDGARFLPGGATVVISGGRIASVESYGRSLAGGIEIVEYDGTLLPGLIDCHTHLVADCSVGGLERAATLSGAEVDEVITRSLRAHLAAGVTTVRDLGDVAYRTVGFAPTDGLPRVVAAGPPITTAEGHCHFLGGAVTDTSDAGLRAAVDEHAERGVEVIKVMASGGFATPASDQLGAQFTASQLAVLVEQAHRAGLPLVAHAHSLVAMRHALAAQVDGIEHFTGLAAPPMRDLDDELVARAALQGTYVDLTMGNDRAMHHLIPQPPPPLAALVDQLGVASFDELYALRFAHLAQLRRHGVRVVAGVDSGMAPPKAHGNVWRVVVEMLEVGYPAADALAAATSVAAAACGVDGETGRVAAGLSADLLVVDGDLATDIHGLASPRLVLARGTPAAPPADRSTSAG